MIRCLVVDDDAMSRAMVENLVARHTGLELVASCESAIEAAGLLRRDPVDLLFLDVEMPDMTGIDLVKSLEGHPQVILVTAKEKYALEAFDVEVTDYLLKPVDFPRFFKAVERAMRRAVPAPTPSSERAAQPDFARPVFIRTEGRLVKLDLTAVRWIEAKGDYVMIHTGENRFLVHATMKAMLKKLPAADFARVHRSFIVRLDHINDIEDSTLVMERKMIPIGPSFRDDLLARLNTL